VARLDEQKGHRYLLEAAVEIPEAVFVLVGDGPERAALEKQVHQLKLEDRVLFFGFRNDIQNWLSACDLFVLPSLYEGLPIAVLEAMAAGKPVIATDIPGNREAVVDGLTGCLVAPQDPRSLAVAIRSLLADSALRKRMGQAGREIVSQKFSMKEMVRQVTEVYTECLEGK
jgi:glycosyltransferase involved in cell wall biosynthesis